MKVVSGRDLEQHIAVFGESGSGKTVMLSSFYGAAQEEKTSLFQVVADSFEQGTRLQRAFLRMRTSAEVPDRTRFSATEYSFSVKLKVNSPDALKGAPFSAVRLVWHDYPGEWFEQDVSGPEEARRRLETFRSLLSSDVAILLVDGQRLLDYADEEEKYLKSLLGNFNHALWNLKDDLLEDGKPLIEFPRIWMVALSKADLFPSDKDVNWFKDLMIEKVGEDIIELRKTLEQFVSGASALSFGEDYLLLSSAKFGDNKIEVTKRVGLDLILPMAAILPLERYTAWAEAKSLPDALRDALLRSVGPLARILLGVAGKSKRLPAPVADVLALLGPPLVDFVADAVNMHQDELRTAKEDALAKGDYLRAMLTQFRLDLKQAEEKKVLLERP